MRVLMYAPRFHDAVRSGSKRSTIRPPRKDGRQTRPGDVLSHRAWSGRPYGKGVTQIELSQDTCKDVTKISLWLFQGELRAMRGEGINARILGYMDLFTLALNEGFEDVADMQAYFQEHHGKELATQFTGELIEW